MIDYKPVHDNKGEIDGNEGGVAGAGGAGGDLNQSHHSHMSDEKSQASTSQYQPVDCNLIIWGKWKTNYDEPILLNIDTPFDGPLNNCILEMVAGPDFCLFITDEGKLYAMGQNDYGMLGLGKPKRSTNNKAE